MIKFLIFLGIVVLVETLFGKAYKKHQIKKMNAEELKVEIINTLFLKD